jgi:hypothetical protein
MDPEFRRARPNPIRDQAMRTEIGRPSHVAMRLQHAKQATLGLPNRRVRSDAGEERDRRGGRAAALAGSCHARIAENRLRFILLLILAFEWDRVAQ